MPQFVSALIIICAVIVVSQLVRLSEVLVTFGLSVENVFLPFLFIMVPFLSLTIPMAYLFAVVLTFGRLSADGEWPALLASGYSLKRAARPTLLVAVVLYGVATMCGLHLEAWGRRELVQFFYRKTQTELDNLIRYKMQPGVFIEDFLGYVFYAETISADRTRFANVLLAPGTDRAKGAFTLLAPTGNIVGSVEGGDLRLDLIGGVGFAGDGGDLSVLRFQKARIDLLHIFREQIIGSDSADDDYRSLTPSELERFVDGLRAKPNRSTDEEATYRRARYLFHQRIASPFAVITFALFGMVLGVSDPRRGKSSAYLGAVVTVMLGYVLMMGFKWLAENGQLSPPWGAWMPNVVLLLFSGFLVYQKHRLPPSEGTLDVANLPFVGSH